nr:signal peptide, CUB and EGF-like domain-containing protein 3 [Pogona vitticeps]
MAPRWCPEGTYNNLTGQVEVTSCQVCPDGYLSLETRAGCRMCPDGYWCDPQSGLQKRCHPGQYSPEGETECWRCPKGYICPDGQEKQHCRSGQEPNPTHTLCVSCLPGFYSVEGTPECQPCPTGHYCPHVGTVQPLPCPPGFWTYAAQQTECQKCNGSSCCPNGIGHFHADGLTMAPCPVGSYEPRERFTRSTNASLYFPGTKHAMQYKCGAGTWSNRTGLVTAQDCALCPSGWFCMAGAQAPSGSCSAGHYCPEAFHMGIKMESGDI